MVLVQSPERKDRFEDLGIHWGITLRIIFKEYERQGVDSIDLTQVINLSGFRKCRKYVDRQLRAEGVICSIC